MLSLSLAFPTMEGLVGLRQCRQLRCLELDRQRTGGRTSVGDHDVSMSEWVVGVLLAILRECRQLRRLSLHLRWPGGKRFVTQTAEDLLRLLGRMAERQLMDVRLRPSAELVNGQAFGLADCAD